MRRSVFALVFAVGIATGAYAYQWVDSWKQDAWLHTGGYLTGFVYGVFSHDTLYSTYEYSGIMAYDTTNKVLTRMKSSPAYPYLGGWGLSMRGGQLRSMVNDGGLYRYDAEGAGDAWTFKATSAQESLEGYLFASDSSEWGDGSTKIWGRSKDGSWAARMDIPSDFDAKGVAEEDSTHMWLLGYSDICALSRSGMSLTLDSCITDPNMLGLMSVVGSRKDSLFALDNYGNLFLWDTSTSHFQEVAKIDEDVAILARTSKGQVWMIGSKLYKISTKGYTVIDDLYSQGIRDVDQTLEDGLGRLWLLGYKSLTWLEDDSLHVEIRGRSSVTKGADCFTEDSSGVIWHGESYWNGCQFIRNAGLGINPFYDSQNRRWASDGSNLLRVQNGVLNVFPVGYHIARFQETSNGEIIGACTQGIFRWDESRKQVQKLIVPLDTLQYKISYRILSRMPDGSVLAGVAQGASDTLFLSYQSGDSLSAVTPFPFVPKGWSGSKDAFWFWKGGDLYKTALGQTALFKSFSGRTIDQVSANPYGNVAVLFSDKDISVYIGRAWTTYSVSDGKPFNGTNMFFMDSRGELWLEYWSDVSKLTTATGNAFDASLALPEGYPLSSSTTIFKGGPSKSLPTRAWVAVTETGMRYGSAVVDVRGRVWPAGSLLPKGVYWTAHNKYK
ncbi:MAG: hypothetical protein AUK31_01050 [Fibrobacteres bacterium CG2_30_45_31]|nr:MAG: hypothetical protein AUK31_01050 [Fibrobacteres bacterium CG2_30_45_31]